MSITMKATLWKRLRALGICAGIGLSCLASDSVNADDFASHAVPASKKLELSAGKRTRELGISTWIIEGELIRGLTSDHIKVAELRLVPAAGTVESVYPEQGGLLYLRGDGENTLGERAATIFDAYRRDLDAKAAELRQSQRIPSSSPNVYEFIDCYTSAEGCAFLGNQCVAQGASFYECQPTEYCAALNVSYPWELDCY